MKQLGIVLPIHTTFQVNPTGHRQPLLLDVAAACWLLLASSPLSLVLEAQWIAPFRQTGHSNTDIQQISRGVTEERNK
jgi:hypothetical protein